jgi:phosphonopyruvate decarboxylase
MGTNNSSGKSAKVDPRILLQSFAEHGFFRAIGVPDSTLEPFIQVLQTDSRFRNLIATNECEAASIAVGEYLGSGRPSFLYLQNSGFGKTIHPITSLLSAEILSIPALLLIGWRGCPELSHDEPQHVQMGRIMPALLNAIEVPFEVLPADPEGIQQAVRKAAASMAERSAPYALIVKPGLFESGVSSNPARSSGALTRKEALETLVASLPIETLYVSTTGKTSRELYFIREAQGQSHESDLYVVGGMGCASSIAFGLAQTIRETHPQRLVCAVDGDGAALMQMGSIATIGHHRPANLLHVLIDNESYESTGGQPTISPTVDFVQVASACGYPWARSCSTQTELAALLTQALQAQGPRLLVVKTNALSDPKLGRPTQTPRENVLGLMKNLGIEPCHKPR